MSDSGMRFGLALDCSDPERLAEFWAPALEYVRGRAVGDYVELLPDGGPGPALLLQQVPEPKTTKNHMHLDLQVPDIHAEVQRLVALGARQLSEEPYREYGDTWIVMADPEGNEFCICDANPS